jgi:putative ABC transport system permease protein
LFARASRNLKWWHCCRLQLCFAETRWHPDDDARRQLWGADNKDQHKDVKGFLSDLKKHWDSFNPAGPLEYNFLDEKFAALYASEQRTKQIFSAFAILAIIIASLGLFGLSAFVIEQRTREIGIRKVLGASVQQVLLLVSKEFLLLVGIAFIISVPVTWWAMNEWLKDFAYRINIGTGVFIAGGLSAILIAFFTISFQAIRAAVANPVKSLRTE